MSPVPQGAAPRRDLAVVVCTYNGGRYLEAQLRSILEQTVLPGEIRIYDDGSTDGTVDLARSVWTARPDRAADVGLVVAPPSDRRFGASENFARALADTPHPLIALSDQDDEWLPERLAVAVGALDADPDLHLVASNAMMVDGDGVDVGRSVFESQHLTRAEHAALAAGTQLPALLRRNLVPGMTFTLRRELIEAAGPIPAGAMHDYWLVAAAAATGRLHITAARLVRYRIHAANAVGLDAGNRSIARRIRIKVQGLRDPLTDLPQWLELPDRLGAAVPVTTRMQLEAKRDFELRRRFLDRSPGRRVLTAIRLLVGDGYLTYDFRGRRQVVRDLLRRRDPLAPADA